MMKFYKYQGAGNDFLIADNRDGSIQLNVNQIASLCDRRYGIGADGLMLLENSEHHDFKMVYYNSDGSGGMMCGNGGRCIVAFAADMGLEKFEFEAADGVHTAYVLLDISNRRQVRLKMKDVSEIVRYERLEGVDVPSDGYFLDTGTRHFVRIVEDVDNYDVLSEGRKIRWAEELMPVGANVNFVGKTLGPVKVRTFEKGVEDETFACGTGIVASCIAAYAAGVEPNDVREDGRVFYEVFAKKDALSVDFIPGRVPGTIAEDVWLTGPASFVAEIYCNLP